MRESSLALVETYLQFTKHFQTITSLALAAGLCPKYYYPISKGRKLRFTEVANLTKAILRKQQHMDLSSDMRSSILLVLMPQPLYSEGKGSGRSQGGQMPSLGKKYGDLRLKLRYSNQTQEGTWVHMHPYTALFQRPGVTYMS